MLISLFFLLVLPFTTNAADLLKVSLSSTLLDLGLPLDALLPDLKKRWNPGADVRNALVKVVATVQTGNNQNFRDVLIDTGSAILWVGGEQPFVPGYHTETINSTFSVGYGAGGVSGTAYHDRVVIGEATANAQIIGAANVTQGFALVKPIDGILGLGPSGSNGGEVSGFDSTPTFVETLVAEKSIDKPVFGVFISPLGANGAPEGEGELTFGGVDTARIRGDVTWVPQIAPVNFHWEFNVTSFGFGKVLLKEVAPARTDTGVLPIAIPFEQLFDIRDAYNGTIAFDTSALSGFLSFPRNATHSLPPLAFVLGGKTFSIPPSRYIVPRNLYPSLNVTDNPALVRTWIGSGGPGAYMLGQKWLENVYTAYDMANHCVGFANLA